MAQFLIVVQVPEVEPLVAALRVRFDPSARRGLGAHITLLHSNLPSDRIDPTLVEQIAAVASAIAPFDYGITRVAPLPRHPVPRGRTGRAVRAAERTAARGPGHGRAPSNPAGSHSFRTSRWSGKAPLDDRDVEAELTGLLERHAPISCLCRQIVLLENSSGLWRPVQEFALSGDTGNPWQAPS